LHDLGHYMSDPLADTLSPMELIATITGSAAITCVVALVMILWDLAERADKAP